MTLPHSGHRSGHAFLQQQNCPAQGRLALSNEDMRDGPDKLYQAMRKQYGPVVPIYLDPDGSENGVPAWLVIGYHELLQVCTNEELFSRDSRYWRELAEGRVAASWWLLPQIIRRDNTRFADTPYHQPRRDALIRALNHVDLTQTRRNLRAPVAELLAAKNRRYLQLARSSTRAYPEMRKFVELLATEGVPMAVASGSSPEAIAAVLAGTGLDAHLRTLVSADEVAQGKPAPDVFLEAARRLGARPADCVVVEDAAPGAAAAHAAGMRCIALPYVADQADGPEFATADLLVRGGQAEFTARAAYDWLTRTA